MCGIFGYVGNKTAEPILVEGLRTLEYRGYDSAGIYVPGFGAVKAVGPIDNLAEKITETIPGTAGIAHTRWATHGEPTFDNAHPHKDASESLWIVHNGIIENFRELRDMLAAQSITCETDTDTEVLAKVIGSVYTGDLVAAVNEALTMVRGTYGIAVMHESNDEEIVVARMGSPIVLGIANGAHFVSSDPSALLAHTKDVIFLDDGELAIIHANDYTIMTLQGDEQDKSPEKIEWDQEEMQKGGYDHFLIKEIMDIPEAIENSIRGRLVESTGKAKLGGLEGYVEQLANLNRLSLVACGSAAYASQVGKYIIEEYAKLPVDTELGSEYRYRTVIPDPNSAVMAITQSGETADTLASVRKAQELDLLTLGIVNVVGSTIARETDAGVYNHAGPEISIASSKAVISQIVVMILITLLIAREKNMDMETGKEIVKALKSLPGEVQKVLDQHEQIKTIAEKYAQYEDAMYIGRKFHAPIAYEGSLKLKEVTYIHAEAYAGGELKHGSIALLDEKFPVIAIVPQDDVYEKMFSNIEEVKARKAPVLAIATEGDEQIADLADDVVYVPKVHDIVQPLVSVIPTYLFAYYVGVARGLNVDRPRNLAKSVTVE